jgi:hypothetical protein
MQWKGLNWGLKQLSMLFSMAQLIVGKLIWIRNPNCTRFLKVSLNLTYIIFALQFGLQGAKFPSACQPGLLQQLLSLKWTEPNLAVIHGHYLDALGPFLKHHPDAVASVVNKLFELLTSLPITFQVHLCFT